MSQDCQQLSELLSKLVDGAGTILEETLWADDPEELVGEFTDALINEGFVGLKAKTFRETGMLCDNPGVVITLQGEEGEPQEYQLQIVRSK